MAEEDFSVVVGFEASRKKLLDVRKAAEKVFRDIEMSISPVGLSKTAQKRLFSGGGTASKTTQEAFTSANSQVQKKLADAEKNLSDAIDERAANSVTLSRLDSSEIDEKRRLISRNRELNITIGLFRQQVENLQPLAKLLGTGMALANQQLRIVGTGLAKVPAGAVENAFAKFERVVGQQTERFRVILGLVNDGSKRLSHDLEGAVEGIDRDARIVAERLRSLGFEIKNEEAIIEALLNDFRARIGKSGNELTAESVARGFNRLSVVLESSASGLPKALTRMERMALDASGSVARLKTQFDSVKLGNLGDGGVIAFEGAGRNLREAFKKQTRILEDSVRATSPLAEEFKNQLRAIAQNVRATNRVTQRQLDMVGTLSGAAAALETMSRPVEALSNRVGELAVRFSDVFPRTLVALANSGEELTRFNITTEQAKRAFQVFGTNFEALADNIISQMASQGTNLDESEANELRTRIIRQLNAALQRETRASNAITAENDKRANSLKKLSNQRIETGTAILSEEQRRLAQEVKARIDGMKRLGTDAVELGATMDDFARILNDAENDIIQSVGADRFRNLTGAEGGDAISAIVEKFKRKIEQDFLGALGTRQQAFLREQDRLAAIERRVVQSREKVARKNQELVDAIDKQIRNQRAAEGRGGSARFSGLSQIRSFAQTLNPQEQERFIAALKKQGQSIKEINTQLTSHNGNLAKSSALVDKLTDSMTTGQKAAFQFGFAAASAAERLLAWASPATFLFQSISLLRDAATAIIRLDSELRRAVIFSPKAVGEQIAVIQGLDTEIVRLARTNQDYATSLIRNSSASVREQANNQALALSLESVIQRSRETGIAVDELTRGIVAAARVGREPFEGPDPTSFLKAVEAFKILEGNAADTDRVVSLLNSALNEFGLSGDSAVSVLAQVAKTAADSALEGQELLDVLVRTGAGLELIAGASVAESLALIQAQAASSTPSVSKLATAIRQFTVLAAENATEIERFSGIKIIEDGQIKDIETFAKLLQFAKGLTSGARESFVSLFTERDTKSTIEGLIIQSDLLANKLSELADPAKAAALAADATGDLFEKAGFKTKAFESNIERLKAALTDLVRQSGFSDLSNTVIQFGTGAVDVLTDVVRVANEIGGVFKIMAAIALPTVARIAQGFREGFLQQQNFTKVQNDILTSLSKELGSIEAINRAEKEGLVTKALAQEIREASVNIAARLIPLNTQIEQQEAEINVLRRQENLEVGRLATAEQRLTQLQAERNVLLREDVALRERSRTASLGGEAQIRQAMDRLKGIAAGAGAVIGFEFGPKIAGSIAESISGDKKVGEQISRAIQASIGGALTGFAFGGGAGGAIIGGLLAGGGAFIAQRKEAALAAKAEAEAQIERTRASQIELNEAVKQEKERRDAKLQIGLAEDKLARTAFEIKQLEIEIARVGEKRAEQQGLFARRAELETQVIQQQLQLRVRDQQRVEQNIAFEESLVRIREKALTIEKSINLVRQAQLGLAQSSEDEQAQINIEFEFDRAQLQNKINEIEEAIVASKTRIAVLNAEGDDGNAQELRRQAGEIERLINERSRSAIDEQALILATLKKREEADKKSADNRIQAFRDASVQAAQAFKNIVQSQFEVVRALGAQGDIFKEISNTLLDNAQIDTTRPSSGLTEDQRLARQLSNQRNALRQQLNRIESIFSQQTRALTATKPLENIRQKTDEFIASLRAANTGLGQFAPTINQTNRLALANLESQRVAIETDIEASRARINAEKEFTTKVIDLRRQEIGILRQEIDAHEKRIEKDAQIGDKLLTAPDEFVKQLKAINFAESLFSGIQSGTGGLQELERRIRRLQSGEGGGNAALRQVLEGLKAATELNVSVMKGLNPEDALSIFQRLLFQNADTVKEGLKKQESLITEIQKVNETIVAQFNRQIDLINEDLQVQRELNRINGEQKNILDRQSGELERIARDSITNSGKSADAFKEAAQAVAKLKLPDFTNIETAGETKIASKVEEVRQILADISRFDPDVQAGKELEKKLIDELAQLKAGNLTDAARLAAERDSRVLERNNSLSSEQAQLRDKIDEAARRRAALAEDEASPFNFGDLRGRPGAGEEARARLEEEIKRLEAEKATIPSDVATDAIDARLQQVERALETLGSISSRANPAIPESPTPVPSDKPVPADSRPTRANPEAVPDLFKSAKILGDLLNEFRATTSSLKDKVEREKAVVDHIKTILEKDRSYYGIGLPEFGEMGNFDELKEAINFLNEQINKLQEGVPLKDVETSMSKAADAMVARLEPILGSAISVNVPQISVQLDARIQQQIQGEEFAAQLAATLQGSGLEDKVTDIQNVVAQLIRTALDRGESFDGADIVDFAGGRLA
jgi:hypothetical protein